MKKGIVSILFIVLSFSVGQAQSEIDRKLPGSIITKDGDIKQGDIQNTNVTRRQKKVAFYDDKGNRTVYKPTDLKGYTIGNQYYESIPNEGLSKKKKVFLERIMDGKINLFVYYYSASSRSTSFGGGTSNE